MNIVKIRLIFVIMNESNIFKTKNLSQNPISPAQKTISIQCFAQKFFNCRRGTKLLRHPVAYLTFSVLGVCPEKSLGGVRLFPDLWFLRPLTRCPLLISPFLIGHLPTMRASCDLQSHFGILRIFAPAHKKALGLCLKNSPSWTIG